MRKMLLFGVWLFSAVRCQQPNIRLSAPEGGLVNIYCPYGSGYETYPKYFYKGIYGKRKLLLQITDGTCKKTQKGKYNFCDDTKKRILHVSIYKLTLNDAGTYWCEIDAYTFDPITEIELRVDKAPAPLKPPLVISRAPVSTTSQTFTGNHHTALWPTPPAGVHSAYAALAGKELYLSVAAAALLSLLVFLFFRLRKHRHDRAGATRVSEDASAMTISQQVENTYSISSPSTETGDQRITEDVHLMYSTVCFNTDAAAQPRRQITSAAGPSEVYATIRHPHT